MFYYDPGDVGNGAFGGYGATGIFKTAIRFTQTELSPYQDWTLMAVNAFLMEQDTIYTGNVEITIFG